MLFNWTRKKVVGIMKKMYATGQEGQRAGQTFNEFAFGYLPVTSEYSTFEDRLYRPVKIYTNSFGKRYLLVTEDGRLALNGATDAEGLVDTIIKDIVKTPLVINLIMASNLNEEENYCKASISSWKKLRELIGQFASAFSSAVENDHVVVEKR